MERLQKVIASTGYASRRKAEELILAGKVYVNGKKVTELGVKVSGDDDITINGKSLVKEDKVYFLLNKPKTYISSVSDEKGRHTVIDLIDTDKRIYPVGRLDYDTTGLLILTNDGELANNLMHPSKHVPKTYIAKLDKNIEPSDLMKLKSGILIDSVKCIPERVREKTKDTIEITIVEGRNHIVKRVFSELGYKVIKLHRSTYAFLDDHDLKVGSYRTLNVKEVKKLYEASK